jgi:hypothetical protein
MAQIWPGIDPVSEKGRRRHAALGFCSGEDKVLNDCRSGKLWVQHNTTGAH